MKFEIREDAQFGEKIYSAVHESGVHILVCPKPLFTENYVMFGTKYGSSVDRYIADGESEITAIPDGTAHFLEHKMFENEDGVDVFSLFGEYGASANAFTSFDKTVYEFSCTDNFEKNLETLIKFVQAPYFTKETVAKEQGIIGQEIKMYDDSPSWRVLMNLMSAVYEHNAVKNDIAGTVESIAEITPEILYKTYNNFYNPANMVLCVCGPADPETVFEVCEKTFKSVKPTYVSVVTEKEPETVKQKEVRIAMPISIPYFCIGIKDFGHTLSPADKSRREIAMTLLLSILFGKSSPLYKRLYEGGYINESFDSEYNISDNYYIFIISGESNNPDEAYAIIREEIEKIKKNGIDDAEFEINKKALLGGAIDVFDKTDDTVYAMLSTYFSGIDFFDSFKPYYTVTKKDVLDMLDIFCDEYISLSVVDVMEDQI